MCFIPSVSLCLPVYGIAAGAEQWSVLHPEGALAQALSLSISPGLIMHSGELKSLPIPHCPFFSQVLALPLGSKKQWSHLTHRVPKKQRIQELKIQAGTESVHGKKNGKLQVGTEEAEENLGRSREEKCKKKLTTT